MPFVGYSYHNSDGELRGHFREFFHAVPFMLIKRVGIGFKTNRRVRVTEYFAQGFNIKAKLQSANAERVPQSMDVCVPHTGLFKYPLMTVLKYPRIHNVKIGIQHIRRAFISLYFP